MQATDNSPTAAWDAFSRFWQDAVSRFSAGQGAEAAPPPDAAQQMRRLFFDAMAKFCDELMRSPQYLELMKQTMDQALAFRKQLNQFLASALQTAQMPTQDDMGEVLQTLRNIQTGLLQRVEELNARVAALEKRAGGARQPGRARTTRTSRDRRGGARGR